MEWKIIKQDILPLNFLGGLQTWFFNVITPADTNPIILTRFSSYQKYGSPTFWWAPIALDGKSR